MRHARIIGTGGHLPERVLTNADLERMVETSDAWIVARTGIRRRHIAAPGEGACDLAEQAARRALEMAGVTPSQVDLVVVATTTPDLIFPSTACLLAERLGVQGAPAFDIQAVCTGFIYALGVAEKFIRTGAAATALVVGAEVLSRIVDWKDRRTCVLFGDGAGAVVLRADREPGILSTHLHADGRYKGLLMVPTGVAQGCDPKAAFIRMQGNEVFKMAVRTLGRIVDETLAAHGMATSEVDWLIPHQANIRIIQAMARKLGLPMERVVLTIEDHGNTSAASVPLALDTAVREGRIRAGDVLLMEAFGGGFTWGSALVRW